MAGKGKSRPKKSVTWTEDDIEFLKNNIDTFPEWFLSDVLNKSAGSIYRKCEELGLKRTVEKRGGKSIKIPQHKKPQKESKYSPWTFMDVQFLRENYTYYTRDELGLLLNKAPAYVGKMAMSLGLELTTENKIELSQRRRVEEEKEMARPVNSKDTHPRKAYSWWTPEEIEYLKENYHTMSNRQLCESLGKCKSSIVKMARRLELQVKDCANLSLNPEPPIIERVEPRITSLSNIQ